MSKDWFEGAVVQPIRPDGWAANDDVRRERGIRRWVLAWLIFIVGILCAAAWQSARADDWLVINGLAAHLNGGDHCNSVTEGLGAESGTRDLRTFGGVYRNSNCRWSLYAGRAWLPLQLGQVHAGLAGGAATGYERPLMPAAAFAAAWEGRAYGANLSYIPQIKSTGNVLLLQLKLRW